MLVCIYHLECNSCCMLFPFETAPSKCLVIPWDIGGRKSGERIRYTMKYHILMEHISFQHLRAKVEPSNLYWGRGKNTDSLTRNRYLSFYCIQICNMFSILWVNLHVKLMWHNEHWSSSSQSQLFLGTASTQVWEGVEQPWAGSRLMGSAQGSRWQHQAAERLAGAQEF